MALVIDGAIGRVVTVLTEAGPVQVIVDENTRINLPSGRGRVLERIGEGLPVRIAVVAAEPLMGDDGQPTGEVAVARKLTIIPAKATREHRRVVIAERGSATKALAVGEGGYSVELTVDDPDVDNGQNAASNVPEADIPEQGGNAILLIRRGQDNRERVTAVVNARRVVERVSDLAGNSKLQGDDPFQSARIEAALERHQSAVQERLQRVLTEAQDRFKDAINRAVNRAKTNVETRKKVRGVVSGLDDDTTECVRSILGNVPVTKKGIPPGQYRRVEVQCLQQNQETGLELTIEPSDSSANVGDTITITLRRDSGEFGNSLEIGINGEPQTPDEVTRTSARLEYMVPRGVSELIIQARTTDQDGETISVSRVLKVRQDPPPRVEIRTPEEGERLLAGSSYQFTIHSEDNGEVVSVDLFVNDQQFSTEFIQVVESDTASTGRGRGQGQGRGPGGDDEDIYLPVQYVALVPIPLDVASVTVRAVATDNVGNIGTAARLFRVIGDPGPSVEILSPEGQVQAGEAITVEVKTEDEGGISSVEGVVIAGDQRTTLAFDEIDDDTGAVPRMNWRSNPYTVPADQTSLTIEVTATDNNGNATDATRRLTIGADAGPTGEITSPKEDAEVNGGESITVEVKADDNGKVVSVTGSITDAGIVTALVFEEAPGNNWRSNPYTVAASTVTFDDPDNGVVPHVFTGAVTLNGTTAPDGTRVAAAIERGSDSLVSIAVTATNGNGNTATATREVEVRASGVEITSGVVSGGIFTLVIEQPLGESFAGEEIRFTIGGQEAAQSGTWERGGATELDISAP